MQSFRPTIHTYHAYFSVNKVLIGQAYYLERPAAGSEELTRMLGKGWDSDQKWIGSWI